jgi:hypothetical protein
VETAAASAPATLAEGMGGGTEEERAVGTARATERRLAEGKAVAMAAETD